MVSAAKQTAPPDKLVNPPRCGGKSSEIQVLRNAARCLTSLSRQTPSIIMKLLAEDVMFLASPTGC